MREWMQGRLCQGRAAVSREESHTAPAPTTKLD